MTIQGQNTVKKSVMSHDKPGKNGLKGAKEVCLPSIIWVLQKLVDEMLNVIDEMEKLNHHGTDAALKKVNERMKKTDDSPPARP